MITSQLMDRGVRWPPSMSVTTDLVGARLALVFQADVERRVSFSVVVGTVRRDGNRLMLDLGRHGVITFRQSWLKRLRQSPLFMRSMFLDAECFLLVEVERPPPDADLRWYMAKPR